MPLAQHGDIGTLGARAQAAAAVSHEVAVVEADRIVDAAAMQWPVKTGRSKAGLRLRVTRTTTFVQAVIVNPVPYTTSIRPRSLGGVQLAWQVYVVSPVMALRSRLGAAVANAYVKELARSHRGRRGR